MPWPENVEKLLTKVVKARRSKGMLLGEDCQRGKGVKLKHSIVGSHCRIGEGAKIERCIVMDHVVIGARTTLKDSVICSNCHVGEDCVLEKTRAGAGTRFENGERVSNEEVGKNL